MLLYSVMVDPGGSLGVGKSLTPSVTVQLLSVMLIGQNIVLLSFRVHRCNIIGRNHQLLWYFIPRPCFTALSPGPCLHPQDSRF